MAVRGRAFLSERIDDNWIRCDKGGLSEAKPTRLFLNWVVPWLLACGRGASVPVTAIFALRLDNWIVIFDLECRLDNEAAAT